MSDLISRQDAIDAVIAEGRKVYTSECANAERIVYEADAVEVLAMLPSADRPTGEWIRNDNGTYSCCVCQSWIPEEQHGYARYCLYCGAKMGGESDG